MKMRESELRLHRCCFTGHRPEKLGAPEADVRAWLEAQIDRAIADGYVTFISGCAMGADIWAAQIVLQKKAVHPGLHLIVAPPWPGFYDRWGEAWREQCEALLRDADLVRNISGHYHPDVFGQRNRWMVDHSNRIIACFDGSAGGAGDMLDYAAGAGIEVICKRPDGPPGKERYVCFDVETPNARNDRMSAIGIAVVEDGRITREFFSYVDPEEPFDRFNTELTGISADTVADAPTFPRLWPDIEPLFSHGTLVAHNAPFDLSVLRRCLHAYGIDWKKSVSYACTVRIGRAALPGMRHGLDDMCAHYGILLDHHKADSDSRACAEILIRYLQSGLNVKKHVRRYALGER
ncbi:MAG: DUF1273 family protein [Clostridia bacterium]|nr:DUF1273 family protein [Clostridia bacterium]